eukprot:COSAG06_NODE_9496_length_1886_cov_12.341914_1_plen_343_part_00
MAAATQLPFVFFAVAAAAGSAQAESSAAAVPQTRAAASELALPAASPAPIGPRADWSHVPIMYFSGVHGNRSEEEIAVLARFDIVAVNKEEGARLSSSDQELRQIETLRRVKALKPSVFTIAYMNSMMNFRSQAIAPKYTSDLLVRNVSGDVALFHGDGWRPGDGPTTNADAAFNLSLPAARQIWLDDLQRTFLDSGVVDGLFADKGNNWAGNGHCNGLTTNPCWALRDRNDTLCQNTCAVIGEEQAAAYNQGKVALFAAAEAMLRARGGLLALKNDTDPLYNAKAQYKRIVRPTRESIEDFIALEGQLDTVIAWALPGNSPHADPYIMLAPVCGGFGGGVR